MNEIEQLKAENERLKEQLAEIGKSWDEIQRLRRENEIITGMHNSSSNRFDKIYQTLQEIKDIAEKEYYAVEPDARYIADKILDLITKAEEE